MNVELKNVKSYAEIGPEGGAFSASIYIDGKKVGTVHNDGWGGPDVFDLPPGVEAALDAEARRRLPEQRFASGGDDDIVITPNAEFLVSDLIEEAMHRKDLRTRLRTRLVTTVGSDLYETRRLPADRLRAVVASLGTDKPLIKWSYDQCLNLMPFEDALQVYRRAVRGDALAG